MKLWHIAVAGATFGVASLVGCVWLFVWAVNRLAGG